jgi:esterase/lipase superfamily enzyme
MDYVICVRNIKADKKFGSEPATPTYLMLAEDAAPKATPDQVRGPDVWAKKVIAEARRGVNAGQYGNLLFFVHGYNNSQATVMQRHRRIRDDLRAAAFKGIVVSFDWPSGDVGAFYLEDLVDANRSAYQLVAGGIMLLAKYQQPDCLVNIHILAHSMGAYVTREAFTAADDADDLAGHTWHVSQIMFVAGDISARSLREADQRSDGLFRCCTRLTNYSSRHDGVLGLSNFKRAGVAPRAGRIGLPDDSCGHAVNVDCSDYFTSIPETQPIIGNREHSWHIGDPVFTQDMVDTMNGVDRAVAGTRTRLAENRYRLIRP